MKNLHHDKTFQQHFFAPVLKAFRHAEYARTCHGFSDSQFVLSGIGRVIAQVESGRDWVQQIQVHHNLNVSVGNFFSALRSKRRLKLLEEVHQHVRTQADQLIGKNFDPLAVHPELDGFALYSTDGHTHGASAHDKPIHGKKRAVTHIYSLNLRTHTLTPLATTTPTGTKKKEHELHALKRIGGKALRMGEPTGSKVLHVYDPAVIDYLQWKKWKQGSGVYIITVEKSNSALTVLGNNPYDSQDPRNIGIVSDELVGPSNGYAMRRVNYIDPVTGKRYSFLTTEMTLPPGLIAFLYKRRWDVEKLYDELKNKKGEIKAWAATATGKTQQALFIALAHNLMRILEGNLEENEGLRDQKSDQKRKKRRREEAALAQAAGRTPNPLVHSFQRATQRCCQFIRWLRACLQNTTSWRAAVDALRPLLAKYLL